ncbi:flavin-containing monooxygenase [Leucobacter chromiireducens]|uniref:NAD(P)/FAD-dependent oxidoreductase n=1 Tax=Leucobacter chromiireducens subsp. solipictus TaxID=398235 RepID=A0ABS1SIK8_9MICO|nr:NAD(P)/FAD-dependent oxidoreductase [Leucobacter chromiireducens]MBL3680404.1 NAD(P)/FAD-dependent oxidoreductase [Leucobacter chromiireducens subsp. solipictus]
MSHQTPTDYDALVIGAGFSGLAMLHHLREAGFNTHVVDGADGIGGTWWINTYPGVRTDSEYSYYSFSFSREVREEWVWKQRYPSGEEVLAYLNFVADRLDLRRDIELETFVDRAEYREADNLWEVRYRDGRTVTTRYLISGMGVLSQPVFPAIPGLESFTGEKYHAARWPREQVDFTGKRVGIIGLGASGIQIVPVVAPQAAEFVVFQRTPNYIVETTNEAVTPAQMQHLRENYDAIFEQAARHPFGVAMEPAQHSALEVSPEERQRIFESKWNEGGFHFANECFTDLATNPEASELAAEFIRGKIRETVTDPDTAELLCPKNYSFNGKRVPTGHQYYATFNRDNVRLVDTLSTPITEITERGVVVDGTEYPLDVLIFATGFDAMTGTLTAIDIVGREGRTLADKWAEEGLKSNLGISVHEFPNFFMSLGVQTPYSNLVVPIQMGAQWLQKFLLWAQDRGIDRLEATPEAEDAWRDETERAARATVMYEEGKKAGAWFMGDNIPGKREEVNVYMGGHGTYQEFCKAEAEAGYPSFLFQASVVNA